VSREEFACKILCLFGGFSAGIREILEGEVTRGGFQRFGEACQAFLRLIGRFVQNVLDKF
jgi:hypothetical protein